MGQRLYRLAHDRKLLGVCGGIPSAHRIGKIQIRRAKSIQQYAAPAYNVR